MKKKHIPYTLQHWNNKKQSIKIKTHTKLKKHGHFWWMLSCLSVKHVFDMDTPLTHGGNGVKRIFVVSYFFFWTWTCCGHNPNNWTHREIHNLICWTETLLIFQCCSVWSIGWENIKVMLMISEINTKL